MIHFRLRVPIHLQRVLGRRVIKRSLGTRDLRGAQLAAYTLAGRYLALLEQARRQLQMNSGWLDGHPWQLRMVRAMGGSGKSPVLVELEGQASSFDTEVQQLS